MTEENVDEAVMRENLAKYMEGNKRVIIESPKTNLFQLGKYTLASGAESAWKIECDAFTDEDIKTLAEMIRQVVKPFSAVIGVPRGGLKLASALEPYVTHNLNLPVLIVDDVLTTGGSMEKVKAQLLKGAEKAIGAVVFARGECPNWVRPLLQLPSELWIIPPKPVTR